MEPLGRRMKREELSDQHFFLGTQMKNFEALQISTHLSHLQTTGVPDHRVSAIYDIVCIVRASR